MDWLFYDASQCGLEPEELKANYNSYLAAGHINVYDPVSVMTAFQQSRIENFWTAIGLLAMIVFVPQPINAIGEYPLCRKFPEDVSALDIIEGLLSGSEVAVELQDSVAFSMCALLNPVNTNVQS